MFSSEKKEREEAEQGQEAHTLTLTPKKNVLLAQESRGESSWSLASWNLGPRGMCLGSGQGKGTAVQVTSCK